jgi:hypothetical protein
MNDVDAEKTLRLCPKGTVIDVSRETMLFNSQIHPFIGGLFLKVKDNHDTMTIQAGAHQFTIAYEFLSCEAIRVADKLMPDNWQKEFLRKKKFFSY